MNHDSGIFADYLPAFEALGESILKKCIFYTHWASLEMNRKRYPGYQFRCADDAPNFTDKRSLIEQMKMDINQVTKNGGYIFLMPAGAGADTGEKAFQALFTHMVQALPDNVPVFSLQVRHEGPVSYQDMLPKRKP